MTEKAHNNAEETPGVETSKPKSPLSPFLTEKQILKSQGKLSSEDFLRLKDVIASVERSDNPLKEIMLLKSNKKISTEDFKAMKSALESVPKASDSALAGIETVPVKPELSREEQEKQWTRQRAGTISMAKRRGHAEKVGDQWHVDPEHAKAIAESEGKNITLAEERAPGEPSKKELTEEIKKETPEAREKLGLGLHNLGFYIEEKKDRFFANVFGKPAEWVDAKGTAGRFFSALKKNYERDANKAHEMFEDSAEGKKRRLANAGYIAGNVLKYGRTVADVVGYTAASPFRYVMLGAMGLSRGSEAAKEARLANEEVMAETRIGGRAEENTPEMEEAMQKAAEEAWAVYEKAKEDAGGGNVSRGNIEMAYRENLPRDVLERLIKEPEPGMASGFLQKMIQKDVAWSARRIQSRLDAIDGSAGPAGEKKAAKEKVLKKYEKHLKDLDRMVTQYGTVDGLAMSAKYAERAGKTVVAAMMVETLALALQKAWENLPDMISNMEESLPAGAPREVPAPKEVPMTAEELSDIARQAPETPGELRFPAEKEYDASSWYEFSKAIGREPTADELAAIKEGQMKGAISREEMEEILKRMKAAGKEGILKEEIQAIYMEKPEYNVPSPPGAAEEAVLPSEREPKVEWEGPGDAATYPPESSLAPEAALVTEPREAYVETVKQGDTVWKLIGGQFEKKFGSAFSGLSEAEKNRLIDAVKDAFQEKPQELGLANIDRIVPDQKLDFSKMFGDDERLSEILGRSGGVRERLMSGVAFATDGTEAAGYSPQSAMPEIGGYGDTPANVLQESDGYGDTPAGTEQDVSSPQTAETVQQSQIFEEEKPLDYSRVHPIDENTPVETLSGEELPPLAAESPRMEGSFEDAQVYTREELMAQFGAEYPEEVGVARAFQMSPDEYRSLRDMNTWEFVLAYPDAEAALRAWHDGTYAFPSGIRDAEGARRMGDLSKYMQSVLAERGELREDSYLAQTGIGKLLGTIRSAPTNFGGNSGIERGIQSP